VSSRKSKATRRQERATRAQADPLPDAARPRPRARRLALLIVLVLLGGGGLLWWNRSRAASGAARAALDVPDPPTAGLEVPVQEIIAQARTNLLARLGSADAWGWYASVLDAHELYAEAEPCYRRAHELAPSDVRFGYNLALVLESLGADPDRSLELYREVARQEPTFPPVHVHIAYNLSRKGDLEGASAAYQTANVSATAGADYTAASGVLSFAPGETNKTITIAIAFDDDIELPETFRVRLLNLTNAAAGTFTTNTVTITDAFGDPPAAPIISISSFNAISSRELLLRVTGPDGSAVVIETTTDFKVWTPVHSATITSGGFDWIAPIVPTEPARFFRVSPPR